MKNEKGTEKKIRFVIENPFTKDKLGTEIGAEGARNWSADFIFYLTLTELELLIERLIELRNNFIKEFE